MSISTRCSPGKGADLNGLGIMRACLETATLERIEDRLEDLEGAEDSKAIAGPEAGRLAVRVGFCRHRVRTICPAR